MTDKPRDIRANTPLTPEPKFTHKGWMLFCPIKLANVESGEPTIAARWAPLEYLLDAAQGVQGLVILLCSLCLVDYEPHFYFKITGELKR